MPAPPHSCVVLVPSGRAADHAFEAALGELNRRGYPVRRLRQPEAPGYRNTMTARALAEGFAELLFLDPAVVFDPREVDRLRGHDLPFVCGIYPWPGRRGLACVFRPGTTAVQFGHGGGLLRVESCGLGFALVRRRVLEAIARQAAPATEAAYFTVPRARPGFAGRVAEDVAFCRRAREAGCEVVVDTSIRLWRIGPARQGWEDAGGDRERHDDFTLHIRPPAEMRRAADATRPTPATTPDEPARNPLHLPATPLAAGFPRVRLYVVTYPANAESLAPTLASVRASDWGEEPTVFTQPTDWPKSRESGSRNFKRALEAAADDGCDFAVILEDDVRVNKHLRHNVLTNPLVARDQCDYLSLFMPDLVADPWERTEPHLGYRLARPRYSGPNRLWERHRVWGSQGYVLSRRLVRAALERWDRLREGQDARVISVCGELRLPFWYTAPCLVEHAPLVSAFNTPTAYAPDFDPDYRLELGSGFRPPEEVPGWLVLPEAELLWRIATGREVLELGTAFGRSAVCLAQSARRVVSVDVADQSEAAEWVRRYRVADKVEFVRGDAAEVCRRLAGPFGLVFIDTAHDTASVTRDIAAALPLLEPGGLLAFHDYPNRGWPDVRKVVDEHARRLGWKRVGQAGFLGVFTSAA